MKKIIFSLIIFFSLCFSVNAYEEYQIYDGVGGCGGTTQIDSKDSGDINMYGETSELGFMLNNNFVIFTGDTRNHQIRSTTGAILYSQNNTDIFTDDPTPLSQCVLKIYGKIRYNNKDIIFFQRGAVRTTSSTRTRRVVYMLGDFGLKRLYIENNNSVTTIYRDHIINAFDFYDKYVKLNTGVIYDMTTGLVATPGYSWAANQTNNLKIIYYGVSGNNTQFITYGTDGKYYNQNRFLEGSTILTQRKEIFNGSLFGDDLEKMNLDSNYKTLIRKVKISSYTSLDGSVQYLRMSVCKGGNGFTTGDYTGFYNASFFGILKPIWSNFLNFGSGGLFIENTLIQGNGYIQFKSFDNNLNYNGISLNYGGNCTNNIGFGEFDINGSPTVLYIYRGTIVYKVFLNSEETGIISGIVGEAETGTSFTGSGSFTDEDIITGIWDLDRDGDGDISVLEYTIAPFTIAQNIITKLLEALKDLWTFLRSIMEIGNISFISNTYAESSPIAELISSGTTNFMRGDNERVESISDIVNVIKWGGMLLIILVILLIFFAVVYNNNSN